MPTIEIAPNIFLPEEALRFSFSRSSGPGGQNVNKVSSKARLHVALAALSLVIPAHCIIRLTDLAGIARLNDTGDLVITAEESRSQHTNRQACLERLRELLLEATRPVRKRRKTKPTRGSNQRRIDTKKKHGKNKEARRGNVE